MQPIILASSSPRRQEILKMMNIPFQVNIPDIDEESIVKSSARETAENIALKKLEKVKLQISGSGKSKRKIPWILAADTVLELDGQIIGKPSNTEEAQSLLQKLNGRTHLVHTAMALYNAESCQIVTKTSSAKVTFAAMTKEEIEWYVSTGEWHGAAGGYRIQSLASLFISEIQGSQSCVTGLPIFELYDMLKAQGFYVL